MRRQLVTILFTAMILSGSCSKSGDGNGGGTVPPPPPDPSSTGEMKATLVFSTGNTVTLNASGNYTLFSRLIDVSRHDTLITATGSLPGSNAQLNVRLTNIDAPGTYDFLSHQVPPAASGYVQCEFIDYVHSEFYSTQQVTTASGSVTIQSITSSSVSGSFHAILSNWYPNRTSPVTTITVSNGSFSGNFTTTYYN